MKITILGSGTSTGVPTVGCNCEVCRSTNPKNKRTRTSILISENAKNILIDTSTDLRYQTLENNIDHIDAVLYTHSHADHIHGIDDMRSFNFIQNAPIPCFGNRDTVNNIKNIFKYIFHKDQNGCTTPQLEFNIINSQLSLFKTKITPIKIMHGIIPILGYKINNMAYITDCSYIPPQSEKKLQNLDLLILDGLRYEPHPTHFNIHTAVEEAKKLNPARTLFTHLTHDLEYEKVNRELPEGMELAYDGMVVEI